MVDVSHEPRWGRIAEGGGEDPYLGAAFAAAKVKAFQGSDYCEPDKVVASAKHSVAYGQPEGGRDYNTTDMSEARLRNLYLPPFRAAIDAGADTVMCSFNAINGVPGCANAYTETDILKGEWGFDGFIESDYTAVAELRACPPVKPDSGPCGHGVAADGPGAGAAPSRPAPTRRWSAPTSATTAQQLLTERRHHDVAHRRRGAADPARQVSRRTVRPPVRRRQARPTTRRATASRPTWRRSIGRARSMVLLKNAGQPLPLDPSKSTALIGPFGETVDEVLGPWWGTGGDAGSGRRSSTG